MSTILVVEDEPGIARLVEDYLEAAGFTVLLASTACDAIAQARASAPALVVLDLGLPDRDGFDVTRELRRFTDVPVVMLTARGDESDRIVGLELGADDYVVKMPFLLAKPFSGRLLITRAGCLSVTGKRRPGLECPAPAAHDPSVDDTHGPRAHRSRARLALATSVLGLALAVAVAAAMAIRAYDRAAAADDIAASRALASAAMRHLDEQPDLAMLLALEALRRVRDRSGADSYEARNSLVTTLTRYPHLVAVLHVDGGAAAVEFSSDGKWLATSTDDGTTRLWDVRRRAPVGRPMQGQRSCYVEPIEVDARFMPGDKALVQTACGFANVFDLASGRRVRVLGGPTDKLAEEETDGVLSPDGRLLVFDGEWSGTRVIDVETGKAGRGEPTPNDAYRIHDAISGDSRILASSRVVSGSGRWSTKLSVLRSGAVVGKEIAGRVLALSPHGDVAVVWRAGVVSLWNVARSRAIGSPLPVDDVLRAAFDASGRRLAVSSDDGFVYVWRLTRAWRPAWLIRLRHDAVLGVRFDPTGKTLATAAPHGTVRLWDVDRWPLLKRVDAGEGYEVAFSPDGGRLVATRDYDVTTIWRVLADGRLATPRRVEGGIGEELQFSRDGRSIISVYHDPGTVVTRDVETGRVRSEVKTWPYGTDDVALSPDGRLVADTDAWGLRFWDGRSGRRSGKPLAAFDPIAFSPDSRLLVSGSLGSDGGDETHTVRFWDVERRKLLSVSSEGTEPLSFAFSPDGETLAVAEEGGVVGLWDVDRRTARDRVSVAPRRSLDECCSEIDKLDFSPDGSMLAVASGNGLTMWDLDADAPLGERLGDLLDDNMFWDVNISPDGGALAVAGGYGVFLVDPLLLSRDIGEWSRRLCTIANRELTELERRRYLGGASTRQTCRAP